MRARVIAASIFSAVCGAAPLHAAERAATVEFSVGGVQVIGVNGQARAAAKGVAVQSGDTVDTGTGRAQLRFTDGACVSLAPQSKFRIDDYRFEGKADGSERGFFSLLSGGLRTITGLVGRTNRRNYQVTTSVATIGIRGTEYKIDYTSSIVGSVGEGAIEVCTGAGCVGFSSGESFLVPSPQSLPQLTDKQVNLPPPPPDNPPSSEDLLVAGNQTGSSGLPSALRFTGTVSNLTLINNSDGILVFPQQTVTFDATGVPTLINGNAIPPAADLFNNGYIALWRDAPPSSVSLTSLSLTRALVSLGGPGNFTIVGSPTPLADVQSLSPQIASYALIAGTTPFAQTPNGNVDGKLTAGALTANFGAGTVDASITVTAGGTTVPMQVNGMPVSLSPSGPTFAGSSANATMKGFFAGPNASFAGVGYSGSSTDQTVFVSGAAAFERRR
jgi:hypothetical protein